MAGRIRTVKPEILEDEAAAGLSHRAWRLWVSSWLLADDYGNLRASPAWLAGQVFWATHETPDEVGEALEELATCKGDEGLVVVYDVHGQRYMHITGWHHQRVDHRGKPRCPGPGHEDAETVCRDSRETVARVSVVSQPTAESLVPDLRPPTSTTDPDQDQDRAKPNQHETHRGPVVSVEQLTALVSGWGWTVCLSPNQIQAATAVLEDGPINEAELAWAKAKVIERGGKPNVGLLLAVIRGERQRKPKPGSEHERAELERRREAEKPRRRPVKSTGPPETPFASPPPAELRELVGGLIGKLGAGGG